MWLTSVLRPEVMVELGTYRGTSYCGFCQAICSLKLATRAFAVDSWQGDPHNGFNGPEVLQELRDYHDHRYGGFSTLLPMTFDEAVSRFSDREIDLLHIDGYHTYEAVRHDFETWRSKMSGRGVILFHDVTERNLDFGVWRLWKELSAQYPSFTFLHEHGLGVLAMGEDLAVEIRGLVELRGEEVDRVRTLFEQLGKRVRLQMERDSACAHQNLALMKREHELRRIEIEQELAGLRQELSRMHELERECQELRQAKRVLGEQAEYHRQQIADLQSSFSWRLVHRLHSLGARVAPTGSKRRRIFENSGNEQDCNQLVEPGHSYAGKVCRGWGLLEVRRRYDHGRQPDRNRHPRAGISGVGCPDHLEHHPDRRGQCSGSRRSPERHVFIPACSLAFSFGCLIYHPSDRLPVIKTPWAALSAAGL